MKLYHAHTFEKLGFDHILQETQRRISSTEAREMAAQIQPISDFATLMAELNRVEEFRQIFELGEGYPTHAWVSTSQLFNKLRIAGNWLSVRELTDCHKWLCAVRDVRKWLSKREEEFPHLHAFICRETFGTQIITAIEQLVDDRGGIRDDASPALKQIRRSIKRSSEELRSTMYRILRKANEQNWSIEREITLRNDRFVIPVRSDAKGRVPGFVQDVSQSGGTVFIEPAEALPLNNKLRELHVKEHNEVTRLLQEISAKIAVQLPELEAFGAKMIQLEIIRAKAKFAFEFEGVLPLVNPVGKRLFLRDAYYPILQLKAKQEKMDVVPVDLELNPKQRIMLISGPNAGGKSVSMKTVGLLQLMLQSGFLVPVHEDSEFRLFESFFLDIGDEQSVESDLSTYTSRLTAWRQMGDKMDRNSLFLIDEFGSGTDPRQGGAIAESFLERFVTQRAIGIITTHYGNLKEYAEVTPGIRNSAMQFDTKALKPTYRLIEGMPGRSYAFEMADRVGVHNTIIKRARKKMGENELDSEEMLKELERKNTRLSRMVAENKSREQKLQQLVERNEAKELSLEQNRKKILRDAQVEARDLIRKANKDIERTIREIKEAAAAKEETLRLRKQLAATAPEVDPEVPMADSDGAGKKGKKKKAQATKPKETIQVLPDEPIQPGDYVKLKSGATHGQLIETQGNRGIVEAGGIRLTVKLKELVKIRMPKPSKQAEKVRVVGMLNTSETKMELNVMGKRVEEALREVDKWLDEVQLAGFKQVRILHGKGGGILRDSIRKHLLDLSAVRTARDAPEDQGGAGWTVLDLK
ncbi:endonuclease MutS2 [Pontibacter sp. G13]|uniref:endonuclease MutS2 n=1 Tax=Pontibacter sp. G13 TaxID=3074898 RepID=UPI00288C430C|nr:Smr/MutS family protein [Pontibacter sp. G13]WNJ19434.1 Smr/MutS family protein [Pontibacter sp. G13]